MAQLRIALASDHGGFEQKEELRPWLEDLGFTVDDFGCDSEESVDYPDYAERAARAVAQGDDDYGILVCGTGIGMMIAANKVAGIRAANLTSRDAFGAFHLSRGQQEHYRDVPRHRLRGWQACPQGRENHDH